MTISGGIKVFDKSACLAKDGSTVVASSADGSSGNVLSMNRYLRWDSVGSNDATTETITITFDTAKTFSRLFLVDMNVKDFKVFYDTNQDFANVTTVDTTLTKIDVTGYDKDTAYFEFDEVTASNILIQFFNTQTANEQKYLTLAAITTEIGTFEGYPDIKPETDANEKRSQVQTGKYITQKNFETFKAKIASEHTDQGDVTIIESMYESQDPFLIWLCGGKFGTSNFSVEMKNWRLKDLYQVQTYNNLKTLWRDNSYIGSPMMGIKFAEEV